MITPTSQRNKNAASNPRYIESIPTIDFKILWRSLFLSIPLIALSFEYLAFINKYFRPNFSAFLFKNSESNMFFWPTFSNV